MVLNLKIENRKILENSRNAGNVRDSPKRCMGTQCDITKMYFPDVQCIICICMRICGNKEILVYAFNEKDRFFMQGIYHLILGKFY